MTRYLHYSSRPEPPQVPPHAMNFLAGGTGPLGVYAYQDDARLKTYAADRPFVFELEPTTAVLHTDRYTARELHEDLAALADVPGAAKAVRLWDKYKNEFRGHHLPFAKLWYVICHVERDPDPDMPIAYGSGSGCADPAYARDLLVELGHEIIDDRHAILYASEPEQAVFLTDASFVAKPVSMKRNPRESFEEQVARYKREKAAQVAALERAFAISPGVILRARDGREQLLIKSGETRAGGLPLRVSTFLPDGPWGHREYKDDAEAIDDITSHESFVEAKPATDADVMAWTSTPEFQRGVAAAALIQAENELRFYTTGWTDREALYRILDHARALARPGTTEAFEEAAAYLQDELRKVPRENPYRRLDAQHFAPNPAWVTRAIAGAYERLEDDIPPKWMPKLSHARQKHGTFMARLKEYGCGAYGCVLPTLDDRTVLKVTTDVTEAEFARDLAATLVVPITVEYRMVAQTQMIHKKAPVFLLWREAAEDVGKLDDHPLITAQHRRAQVAYEEMYRSGTTSRGAIAAWRESVRAMGKDPQLAYLARGMLRVYDEQGIFFGDVHGGNVGRCVREHDLKWVIIDPGHVSVIK